MLEAQSNGETLYELMARKRVEKLNEIDPVKKGEFKPSQYNQAFREIQYNEAKEAN